VAGVSHKQAAHYVKGPTLSLKENSVIINSEVIPEFNCTFIGALQFIQEQNITTNIIQSPQRITSIERTIDFLKKDIIDIHLFSKASRTLLSLYFKSLNPSKLVEWLKEEGLSQMMIFSCGNFLLKKVIFGEIQEHKLDQFKGPSKKFITDLFNPILE
jgi:hypothetical protein